jgi:hypothetical protein
MDPGDSSEKSGDVKSTGQSVQPITRPTPQTTGTCHISIAGWKSLAMMGGMLFVGILTAIGHDRFYTYLNDRVVTEVSISQAWVIRAGTAFAFWFKTVLVMVVGNVFCQVFWFTMRHDALQMGTIDAIFNLTRNPLKVFNTELLRKRVSLVLLAVTAWLIPVCAIFSPGTMTG